MLREFITGYQLSYLRLICSWCSRSCSWLSRSARARSSSTGPALVVTRRQYKIQIISALNTETQTNNSSRRFIYLCVNFQSKSHWNAPSRQTIAWFLIRCVFTTIRHQKYYLLIYKPYLLFLIHFYLRLWRTVWREWRWTIAIPHARFDCLL